MNSPSSVPVTTPGPGQPHFAKNARASANTVAAGSSAARTGGFRFKVPQCPELQVVQVCMAVAIGHEVPAHPRPSAAELVIRCAIYPDIERVREPSPLTVRAPSYDTCGQGRLKNLREYSSTLVGPLVEPSRNEPCAALMQRALTAPTRVEDVRINHRRSTLHGPEALARLNVVAPFEQVRGEGMVQAVGGRPLVRARRPA